MRVLLVNRYGQPLLVWEDDLPYRRNLMGFEAPTARESSDESLDRRGDERPPVVAEAPEQAQAEGVAGEGAQAPEDQP